MRSGAARPKSCVAVLQEGKKQFGADPPLRWEYFEAGTHLDDLAQLLPAGAFTTQQEIGDYFGVTRQQAAKYLKRGLAYGLWTDQEIARGLTLGKKLRDQRKTEAPVRLDLEEAKKALSEDDEPAPGTEDIFASYEIPKATRGNQD